MSDNTSYKANDIHEFKVICEGLRTGGMILRRRLKKYLKISGKYSETATNPGLESDKGMEFLDEIVREMEIVLREGE